MALILFANNATTTLAGSINTTATSLQVATGTGALFPSPTGGNYFVMTLTDAATQLLNEIVHVTGVSGDTFTIVRAQEGTTAQNWTAGDICANLCTAGTMGAFAQGDASGFAPINSPAFTGTPTAPTPTGTDNTTKIATTAYVTTKLTTFAPLASPALTGSPTAPTASTGDSSTLLATTAFVKNQAYITTSALSAYALLASPAFSGSPTSTTPSTGDNSTRIATTNYVQAQGYATTGYVNAQGFITSGSLAAYATTSYVNSLFDNSAPSGYSRAGTTVTQFGSFSGVMNGGGTATLPISFPNAFLSLVVSPTGASGSNNALTAVPANNQQFNWGWPSTTGGTFTCFYIAVGY